MDKTLNVNLKNIKVYPETHKKLVIFCAEHEKLIQDIASKAIDSYLRWQTEMLNPNRTEHDNDQDSPMSRHR